MRNKNQQKGFTLIELLVVIVILGILSTISVGTFRSYFAKARDSERVSTVQNIAMMMKVDSGGSGDCGVYNYQEAGAAVLKYDGATELCTATKLGRFTPLLQDNDYALPDVKNGLKYYYGFLLGDTEGDNEFFVMVGAEETDAQNGKTLTDATSPFKKAFIDGTSEGVTMAEVTCTYDATTGVPTCTDYEIIEIVDCTELGTQAPCDATALCTWNTTDSVCE